MNTSESRGPTPGQVFSDPVLFLAFGLGSGLSPKAPGTAGSLVALLIYYLLLQHLGPLAYLAILVAGAALGVYLCEVASARLGVHDHGGIVWDEFIGLWLALFALPAGTWWPLLGFTLFRLFDIVKPPPIGWLDKHIKGGMGIMVDDIIAGSFAFICLQLLAVILAGGAAPL
jgi:phosphatidylglycerophosphatase A